MKKIEKMLKEGLLMYGNDERLTFKRLPTGIPYLDAVLGGGWPYGRTTMLVGPESTGKTLLAQYAVAAQQRTELPHALLVDTEFSYDAVWWAQSGVNTEDLLVCQPQSGEIAINVMRQVLEVDEQLGIIVLDSIAALTPMAILERTAEQKTMGSRAQLVNLMLSTVANANRQVIFLLINQLRENLGGYEEVYPGGMGLRHMSHIILRTRREGWIKEGDVRVGFQLELVCKKNKTAIPQLSATIPFRFTGQIDFTQAYIDEACEEGVVKQNPPYYTLPEELGGQKFLGKNNLRQYLLDNPEVFALLKTVVSDAGRKKTS